MSDIYPSVGQTDNLEHTDENHAKKVNAYVWNSGSGVWERMTQPGSSSSTVVYDIKNISPSTDPEIATYKYFGFLERGGTNWRIMRKTLATNVFEYATGTSGYATAWTNKSGQSYS